jgi:hypothetical protein
VAQAAAQVPGVCKITPRRPRSISGSRHRVPSPTRHTTWHGASCLLLRHKPRARAQPGQLVLCLCRANSNFNRKQTSCGTHTRRHRARPWGLGRTHLTRPSSGGRLFQPQRPSIPPFARLRSLVRLPLTLRSPLNLQWILNDIFWPKTSSGTLWGLVYTRFQRGKHHLAEIYYYYFRVALGKDLKIS